MRPQSKNLYLALLSCAAMIMGAAMPANAMEFGQPDSAYVNVGVLGMVTDFLDGEIKTVGVCSGFVISDRAFVTAAHCIDAFRGAAQDWAVALEPGSPDMPVVEPGIIDFQFSNIFDFKILVDTHVAIAVHEHPWFDPATREFDVAVLEFPAGTLNVPPVRVARFGWLNWLKRLGILDSIPVGVVGYGADGIEVSGFSVPGYRKRGFSSIGSLSRSRLTLAPTPILDAMLLPGDSGSPQFVLGRAVSLSSGDGGVDMQRLDIPAVRRFLAQFR